MQRLASVILALATAMSAPAWATTADDICAPAADPCVVAEAYLIQTGSTLDFGTRALVLAGGSGNKLDVGDGSMIIKAGSLTIHPGAGLIGKTVTGGGSIQVTTTGAIDVLAAGSTKGRIDVSNLVSPGFIILTAGGDIVINGILSAAGTGIESGLGGVDLTTVGDLTVRGDLLAFGGGFDTGGDVFINVAGHVMVSGLIDTSGGDGGDVSVAGDAGVTFEAVAKVRVQGTSDGGSAGDFDVTASAGSIDLRAMVNVSGATGVDIGGDGGDVTLDAQASVELSGDVDITGGVPDGDGGSLDVTAKLDYVQLGTVTATGRRQFGSGGGLFVIAERDAMLGPTDVSGLCDTCLGGDVRVQAWCTLTVPSSATIDAFAQHGGILLETGREMRIAGRLRAGSLVDLARRLEAFPADLTGATIVPTPLLRVKPTLPACSCDPGPCGDGVLNCGEQCDDGGTTRCDAGGCADDCSRLDDVCGDGIRECDESCDPGSAVSCELDDTCSAVCEIEGCGNGVVECEEECDEGSATSTCGADCRIPPPPGCGNGMPDPGEGCDDGGFAPCDGCSRLCQVEMIVCGDGVVECSEQCDDLNNDPCDGCSPFCVLEECGNGLEQCGEECDEGAMNGQPGSGCLADSCLFGEVCHPDSTGPCVPCGDVFDCDSAGICGGIECVAGICEMNGISCNDGNPCTSDGCSPETGCSHTLLMGVDVTECDDQDPCTMPTCDEALGCQQSEVQGLTQMTCRTPVIRALLGDAAVDPKVSAKMIRLLNKVEKKVSVAAQGVAGGKAKKIKKGLKGAGKLLGKMRKKIERFAVKGKITDLGVATMLLEKIDEARDRTTSLRDAFGV